MSAFGSGGSGSSPSVASVVGESILCCENKRGIKGQVISRNWEQSPSPPPKWWNPPILGLSGTWELEGTLPILWQPRHLAWATVIYRVDMSCTEVKSVLYILQSAEWYYIKEYFVHWSRDWNKWCIIVTLYNTVLCISYIVKSLLNTLQATLKYHYFLNNTQTWRECFASSALETCLHWQTVQCSAAIFTGWTGTKSPIGCFGTKSIIGWTELTTSREKAFSWWNFWYSCLCP